MKNFICILFVAISFVSANAQLSHTQWAGTIKGDNPQKATLKFGKDTVILYSAADGSVLETMAYKVKEGTFTLRKLFGQSDCDNITVGLYKFVIKAGVMDLTVTNDNCNDRSSALNVTRWTKVKG